MARIKPFKGVLYSKEKVGDMAKVMAPPYDVISEKFQDDLYKRHENNVIRLILGKTSPDDKPGSDRYSRSAQDLCKWLNDGVLKKDDKPAIYYYTQTYTQKDGSRPTRKGFIAMNLLEEFGKGGIHPHEKTLSGPKADRLKLMQACSANLCCIFSLYSDPQKRINAMLEAFVKDMAPQVDVADDDGIVNKVWRVDDEGIIAKVAAEMEKKPLFIADGHHRYETALNYRNYMREKTGKIGGSEPFDYVQMYFSNMDDEGMTIWPTHRVVHSLKDFDASAFLEECKKYFDVKEYAYTPDSEQKARKGLFADLSASGERISSFGLVVRGTSTYYLLSLKSADVMDKVFGTSIPEVFKALDVTVLHSLVFSKILGVTQESQERQENLVYVKNSDEAVEAGKKEPNQLSFILNPTRIEQVKSVAEAGHVMPQKSTYFYPKLLSGLTFNLLSDEACKPC